MNVILELIVLEKIKKEKEMAAIAGGDRKVCQCSCYYDDQEGGSSTADNANANYEGDKDSAKGCTRVVKTDEGFRFLVLIHE